MKASNYSYNLHLNCEEKLSSIEPDTTLEDPLTAGADLLICNPCGQDKTNQRMSMIYEGLAAKLHLGNSGASEARHLNLVLVPFASVFFLAEFGIYVLD